MLRVQFNQISLSRSAYIFGGPVAQEAYTALVILIVGHNNTAAVLSLARCAGGVIHGVPP